MVTEASRLHARRCRSASKIIASFAAAAAIASLAGCGTSSNTSTATDTASDAGFPVTIKSAVGSATITSKPKRVSTVGWTNQDAVLALGVVPVDMPKVTYADPDGDGMYDWTKAALKKLGGTGSNAPAIHDETDDIDAEAIASADPDVILGVQSAITKKQFTILNKIAPTVAYPDIPWGAPWRQVVTESAKALGLQAKGKKVISSAEATISKALSAYPQLKGKTASVMYFDTSKLSSVSVYTTVDPREQYLNDLGLATPQSVTKLSKNTTSFYKTVSSEQADTLDDVDIIIAYGDSSTLATLQKDPLLGKIPAIKRGSVAVIDQTSTLAASVSPSVLSISATVKDYAKVLAAAADKVK